MADAAEDVAAKGGAVWKDLFSGAVGGIAQVLIGRWHHSLSIASGWTYAPSPSYGRLWEWTQLSPQPCVGSVPSCMSEAEVPFEIEF